MLTFDMRLISLVVSSAFVVADVVGQTASEDEPDEFNGGDS